LQTYLLSDEDIRRYGRDLLDRWRRLGDDAPTKWFALGLSGDRMAVTLVNMLSAEEQQRIDLLRLTYDRSADKLTALDEETIPDRLSDTKVFLIDSAIHSGATMRAVAANLARRGASLMTYSLVLKRTSEFIPSFFGLLIDEHDRALFQLEKLPNNRLQTPFGYLRAINADDVKRTPNSLQTGVASIAKITFGDLYYDKIAHDGLVYVYEQGNEIRGYIHFTCQPHGVLAVDTILTDQGHTGKGIGGAMMRWAETFARSRRCTSIELWSIENQREFYRNQYFEFTGDEPVNLGDGETYYRMSKRVLYNVKPAKELLD
jgi:GNAT superfamily N-acetyltransferase